MLEPGTISLRDVSDLVGALAWPLVVLITALIFRSPLLSILRREEVDLKGPAGFGISARGKDAATEALVQASSSKDGSGLTKESAEADIEVAIQGVESLGRPPQVLWVDDRPSNNRYEASALVSLGMHVELSTSTDDALRKVAEHGRFDVIISDMGRPPDDQAGYTLLDELRRRGDATPFVIYAASRAPEHFNMAVERGALGCTNMPDELIEMVSNSLRSSSR